jgi:hypothetical protein
MSNPNNATKVVAIPFTLRELEVLDEFLHMSVKVMDHDLYDKKVLEQLQDTVGRYLRLVKKDPDSLPAVSMLNAEYQEWQEKLDGVVEKLRNRATSAEIRAVVSPSSGPEVDPRQLEIPLEGAENTERYPGIDRTKAAEIRSMHNTIAEAYAQEFQRWYIDTWGKLGVEVEWLAALRTYSVKSVDGKPLDVPVPLATVLDVEAWVEAKTGRRAMPAPEDPTPDEDDGPDLVDDDA